MSAARLEMPTWECLQLLGREPVGRLCIIDHGYPLAFPLNYRLLHSPTRLVFRTNPGSTIAAYEGLASFELDHIDLAHDAAWSVIARGTLRPGVEQAELADTHQLVKAVRFTWIVLEVTAISGRRFTAEANQDAFAVEWQAVPSDTESQPTD